MDNILRQEAVYCILPSTVPLAEVLIDCKVNQCFVFNAIKVQYKFFSPS